MRRVFLRWAWACLSVLAALPAGAQTSPTPVEISLYYPVAVGGPISQSFEAMVADFHAEHPGIRIQPVYSGSYQDTALKALTAHRGGTPPVLAMLSQTDMYTLIDEDAIMPITGLLRSDAERQWLDGFFDVFLQDSRANGHTWGVPFQRSTAIMYYNKALFRQAGLDPEQPPDTWDELVAAAQKLTRRDASGRVTQWGIVIPSGLPVPYWPLQALAIAQDKELANDTGTAVYFDSPAVVTALQFWLDLGAKYQVMAPGIVDWNTTPRDFLEQKAAIMWNTTGNLTYIRANADFPFGAAMIPRVKRRGSPIGGANFYIFKKTTPAQQRAALRFVQWATQPERAAWWGITTGYIAVTPAAWQTEQMRQYVADFPQAAVARDQLAVSVPQLATHDQQRVAKVINDAIQSALIGTKTPELALKDAQREADRLLRRFQP